MRKAILAVLTTAMLTACSSGERSLHDLRKSTGGPDEFSVSPVNQGIPRADAALVAHTARNGVDANIRANLAAEDAPQ